MSNETKGMLLGALGVTAFGLTLPATKHIVPYMDPVFIGLGRAVVAALFASLILIITRSPTPNTRQFKSLLLVCLGVVIGFPVFSAWSMQSLNASHGGVVLGILPLATAIAGSLFSGERPSFGFWLASLVGTMLVITYSLTNNQGSISSGDLMLLVAVISAAIGYAVGAKLSSEMGGWRVICWALVIALPFILIPAYLTRPQQWQLMPHSAYLSFAYLALVSQLAGFFLWYRGLALGGVARVSQIQLLQPFITLLAAGWLLNEIIDQRSIVFAAFVMLSVLIGKRMAIQTNHKPAT